MKYAILHGNYNIYHAEFETYEEAKEYYDELVKDEGADFDLQLCKILETHEAPEQEHAPLTIGRHFKIDTSALAEAPQDSIASNWKKAMKKLHSEWFDKGKY